MSPELQGRGIGSALMQPVLERCDRDGMPAYLEATTPRGGRSTSATASASSSGPLARRRAAAVADVARPGVTVSRAHARPEAT